MGTRGSPDIYTLGPAALRLGCIYQTNTRAHGITIKCHMTIIRFAQKIFGSAKSCLMHAYEFRQHYYDQVNSMQIWLHLNDVIQCM